MSEIEKKKTITIKCKPNKLGIDTIIVHKMPNIERLNTKQKETVNHPKHYNMGKIEVIDFIEDQKLDFHEGNAIKYIIRAKHKGNEKEDIRKAIWYLKRYLKKE